MSETEIKRFKTHIKLLESEEVGRLQAMFSVFNMRDSDNDVVLPSFFTHGQEAVMSPWGHDWQSLPPGKGVIKVQQEGAVFDGQFFMDTDSGLQHYRTIKNLGGLQEWSFGFAVTEAKMGPFDDGMLGDVRFLIAGETYEVSPVLVGANRDTHTLDIKGHTAYAQEGETVLIAVTDFLTRSRSLADLRAKEGRVLSDANRKRLSSLLASLQAVGADIEELLTATEPPAKGADIAHLFVEFQHIRSELAQAGIGA